MKFHILTLFPDMIMQGLHTSIIGRAVENRLLEIEAVNIRDYTTDKHGKVDDYTYGGGAGMLMQAQPVFDAWNAVSRGKKIRTIYVTPQGQPFNQQMAKDFAGEEELILLCGHYEGIDERVLEETVTDFVSIGDYVLTGGELPAMVITDAVARLVPGVLNNEISAETESFHNDLLEYPQYSRPEIWHEKQVPSVLLSGNHEKITKWRLEQSEERTKRIRPDLFEKYQKKMRSVKRLTKNKRSNIHIMESLRLGRGQLLIDDGNNLLVYDEDSKQCMIHGADENGILMLLEHLPKDFDSMIVCQDFAYELITQKMSFDKIEAFYQSVYTGRETLPVKYKEIRLLDLSFLSTVCDGFGRNSRIITDMISRKQLFGCFLEGQLVGIVGVFRDGRFGELYVDIDHRRMGIGASLEGFVINLQRTQGCIPYCNIPENTEGLLEMQSRLGLYTANHRVWRLGKNDCESI